MHGERLKKKRISFILSHIICKQYGVDRKPLNDINFINVCVRATGICKPVCVLAYVIQFFFSFRRFFFY